jgi:imidazolonepropionase-like amidohydrolase
MKKQSFYTIFLTLSLVIFLFSGKFWAFKTTDNILAIQGGTLIDGTGSLPLPEAVIIIKNEYISAVGKQESIKIPEGAKVIRLKDCTILPGFINAHVHNGYNEQNLQTWAINGVTTVRDLGGDLQNDLFSFRNKTLRDSTLARLVVAGPMLTVPGGYPKVPWGSPAGLPVTSADDAREKTIKLLDDGADIIKIALESGERFQQKIPVLSQEEAKAIVEAAHQRGTIVSAHVLMAKDLENALKAGVDDIAHMVTDDPSDELIKRVVDQGVYWVPTLELWHGVGSGMGDVAIRNLRRFIEADGKVALGTDFDGYSCPFDLGMPIKEIRWMKEAGMSPMQIIVAATKNAAYVCNLTKSIGTLESGKMADVLVVRGNPLEDLETLMNPVMVIHGGEIIRDRH